MGGCGFEQKGKAVEILEKLAADADKPQQVDDYRLASIGHHRPL